MFTESLTAGASCATAWDGYAKPELGDAMAEMATMLDEAQKQRAKSAATTAREPPS